MLDVNVGLELIADCFIKRSDIFKMARMGWLWESWNSD